MFIVEEHVYSRRRSSGSHPFGKAEVDIFNMDVDGIDNVSVFSLVSLFYFCFIGKLGI